MSADMSKPGQKGAQTDATTTNSVRSGKDSVGDLGSENVAPGAGIRRVIAHFNRFNPVDPTTPQAPTRLGAAGLVKFLDQRAATAESQSNEQMEQAQGRKDAASFLRSIETLRDSAWDKAVEGRIRTIENSRGDSPLTVRDLSEIGCLGKELRETQNERFHQEIEASEAGSARHDEWLGELTIQANLYPESDMPK